ncbi:DUF4190 domain-containing protein [Archangium lansingense]|uniref:DUF4190 domain-containing protein n=1 Tax=Archangium lansingense TaxID=2995310 RepID=A0ABT4APB1_9BACT|nr:DUF4190 domain-containing protein [Archangium lansinium]MCY1083543.1 DUF4190 domain-containing protein [Archangium lansinium]
MLSAPRCAEHQDVPAAGICGRCGGFFCEGCATWVLGAVYCTACGALPEVNYLETFRLKLWGKRDTWAWFLGFLGLATWVRGLVLLASGDPLAAALLLACSAVGVGCFWGQRWARVGLLALPVGLGGAGLVQEQVLPVVATLFLLPMAFSIHQDPRHKLFFRLPLPEPVLRRLWNRYENNPLALVGLQLGLYGVFFPLFAPVALGLGLAALRRVNPEARPPIGRRGQALAAMALGVGSLALWGGFLGPRLQELLGELLATG